MLNGKLQNQTKEDLYFSPMSTTYDKRALLFKDSNIDITAEDTIWIDVRPSNVLDKNTEVIEFNVPKNFDSFWDLRRSYLEVEAKVVNADGSAIPDAQHVGVINNLGHTMFRTLECTINQHQFSSNPNFYPIRCYWENLLGFTSDAQKGYLQAAMWFPDTHGQFSETNPAGGANEGLVDRFFLTKESRTFKLASAIHHDIFMQDRLFISGTEISLRLYKSRDKFTIMNANAQLEPRLEIVCANMRMCLVKLSDVVKQSIEKNLAHSSVKYPNYATNFLKYPVQEGNSSIVVDNLFPNKNLPEVIVVGFVKAENFNGTYTTSPLEFNHHNLASIGIYINDVATPQRPLTLNFEKGQGTDGFMSLFTQLNTFGKATAPNIGYKDYMRGYTLYAFNLSPTASSNDDNSIPKPRQGVVKLEAKFSKDVEDLLYLIIMSKTPKTLEVDKTRQLYHK